MSATLRFDNIGKVFPGVRALDGVSFDVNAGEVHGLMGENGAGKSTLLKVLGGEYQPDSGRVLIDGNEVKFASAAASIAAGIAVIHQELQYVPDLTVAENLLLGALPNTLGWVHKREGRKSTFKRTALQQMGVDLDPNAKLKKLSIAQRQMVEICKALLRNARVIALDEPTSSLSHRETEVLFKLVRDLQSGQPRADLHLAPHGRDLRVVQHMHDFPRWPQDRVARESGRSAARYARAGNGRAARFRISTITRRGPLGDVRFAVKNVEGHALREPTSFEVRRGEIVGFFGLVGAGRSELMHLVYGADKQEGPARSRSMASRSRSAARAKRSGTALCCVRKTGRKRASSRWRRCPRTSTSRAADNYLARGACSSTARKKRQQRTVSSSC